MPLVFEAEAHRPDQGGSSENTAVTTYRQRYENRGELRQSHVLPRGIH